MLPRTLLITLTLLAATAVVAPAGPAAAGTSSTDGRSERAGVRAWMEVSLIDGGYRYRASLHDNRLTVTRAGARVRFADTAARVLRALPPGCRRAAAERGLAVTCRIPEATSAVAPLELRLEPGSGGDRVDTTTLGPELAVDVLAGAGDDRVTTGVGADFVNGADGADTVHTGPGDDTVRAGDGDDVADGGAGDDTVLGVAGADQLAGSIGDDRLEGGVGNDLLLSGPGEDILLCGDGVDTTDDDGDLDSVRHCENTIS